MCLRFGDFTLDSGARQLRRGREDVALTPLAFELLLLLTRARPRAVSKIDIRRHLWPDVAVSDGSLTVLVAELRAALDDDAAQPRFIRTVRGFGYSFCGTPAQETDSPPATTAPASRLHAFWIVAAIATAALIGGVALVWHGASSESLPQATQLTFRRGLVGGARFAPGGHTVVFSGLFDGRPAEVFRIRTGDPEPEALGLPPARLLAVSSREELALLLAPTGDRGFVRVGALARAPLSGGTPRVVCEGVLAADWSPDGTELAVLRRSGASLFAPPRVEYPIGNVLLGGVPGYFDRASSELTEAKSSSSWWFSELRVSPDGERVAVAVPGAVHIVDRQGHLTDVRVPTDGLGGVAWDPTGRSLWVTCGESLGSIGVWNVGLDGRGREVYRPPGLTRLLDVAPGGRLLLQHGSGRQRVRAKPPGDPRERDLETRYRAVLADLSPDGTLALTAELSHPSSRESGALYLRPTAGGPGARLGDLSYASRFTADGQWLLGSLRTDPKDPSHQVPFGRTDSLIPIGSGEARPFPPGPVQKVNYLDGVGHTSLLVCGAEDHSRPPRSWLVSLQDGTWRPVTPEGTCHVWIRWPQREVVAFAFRDLALGRYPLDGGTPITLPPFPGDMLAAGPATADGRFGFVARWGVPAEVERFDLETGERSPWLKLEPEDPVGLAIVNEPVLRPESDAYAYTYSRYLFDLFLVEGVR